MIIFERIAELFKKGRGILSFALCMAVSLSLLFSDNASKQLFHEVTIATVLAPVEALVSINRSYFKVYKENKALKIENANLKVKYAELKEFRQQNQRLREMIDFKNQHRYNLVPGEVVARDPGRYEMTWIINLGKADSIEMNMPVLTTRGIVGKVAKVFHRYSVVQLVHDPNCKVSVIVQRSRVSGIMESFQIGRLVARFPSHANLLNGDTLITSGMGGVFPKGLFVGTIAGENLQPTAIFREMEVTLFQNTELVEEVFVYQKISYWTTGG